MHITVCSLAHETPFGNGFKVCAVDYNHLGLAFDGRIEFAIGEQLELELRLGGVTVPHVLGIVRNHHDNRYGVQFDYSAAGMQSDAMITALETLEDQLKGSYSETVVSTAHRKVHKRDRYSD